MDSPDLLTQQAADYQAQLENVRKEILRREDLILMARESSYRNPGASEVIRGDARAWTAEIKVLQKQAEVLNKLIARSLQLQSLANREQSYLIKKGY